MTLKNNFLGAAAAILLATGSAHALDLGLGGGGDIGGIVDLNSDGPLVDLSGNGDAVVNLDLGGGDNSGGIDLGSIADLGGGGLSIGDTDLSGGVDIGGGGGNYASVDGSAGGWIDEDARVTIDNGNGPLIDVNRGPGNTNGDVNLGGVRGLFGSLPSVPNVPTLPNPPNIGGGNGGNGGNGGLFNGGLLGLIFGNGNPPAGGGAGGSGGAGGAGGNGSGNGNGTGGTGGNGGIGVGVGGGGGGGGIGAAFYALPARQQQALVNRCGDVLVRPRMYDADLLALCRFLAQQQQATQAQYRR